MKRLAIFVVVMSAVIFGSTEFWEHRVEMAAVTAAQYAPRKAVPTVVPEGTKIQAILNDQIIESTRAGDPVIVSVLSPVTINHRIVVPVGTPIKGVVHEIVAGEKHAAISFDFGSIVINQRDVPLETDLVPAQVPVETDIELFGDALSTVMGGGIGAALGAVAESEEAISTGLAAGAQGGRSDFSATKTPLTLVLSEPLELPL